MTDASRDQIWIIVANVHNKKISISCGDASQSIKWLAHVAIARWDDAENQGWKRLGVPVSVHRDSMDGIELKMSLSIRDVLRNGDQIFIKTSLQPHETLYALFGNAKTRENDTTSTQLINEI